MNVLYLHQYFTTPEISGGTRSYTFAKKLIEKGHKVTMVTSSRRIGKKYSLGDKKINFINIDGIDVVSINVSYSQNMSYIKRIISFILFMVYSSLYLMKKRDYDIVFATSTPLSIAIPALVAKFRNKIPFVFEVRDLWPEYIEDFGIVKNRVIIKILEKFCSFVYKKADHIVAISNSMANRVKIKYNINSNKLSVLPIGSWKYLKNGLDEDKINIYIEKFDLKDKFVIGYAGTLGFTNNIDSIIKMAKVLNNYVDIVILIAGDGKERNRMEKEIKDKQLTNIKLVGKYSQFEVVNIIELFDIAYQSELEFNKEGKKLMNGEDALPNKFFDYILMGKPMLINTTGEITSLMEEYKFGFYINDKDEEKIKETILKLKNNKELRKTMSENSLKLSEKFDRDQIAKKLIYILEGEMK
ncbi:glycosyltransferase family 4 protein [Clostridium sp. D2Q-11]|uniref:Glycosyltransferase family 4 protein n=1 Tax=Anaeromonas frigoriresistens TaxID=2683708 RepID=A0A942V0A4_9FIRM|nr:glycosyltransferase family 4 protein [Anaeromonas frigoriresistens]MBS4538827.1 glycosyltransferase family 4 protein [Anaeromonas frigoriresistens]